MPAAATSRFRDSQIGKAVVVALLAMLALKDLYLYMTQVTDTGLRASATHIPIAKSAGRNSEFACFFRHLLSVMGLMAGWKTYPTSSR